MREHGTTKRYKHGPDENGIEGKGCRCRDCREACRVDMAARRHRPASMVSSIPARRALMQLRGYGWTIVAVGEAIGDRHPENLLRRDRCSRATSDAICGLLEQEVAGRSTRLPLQPILDELAARGCITYREQAEWLDIAPRQLYRWLEAGVPLFTADRFAVMLERHPLLFWDDFFEPSALSPSAA